MPYDSASGAYIRRTTTVLDETPDGDTVNTAVAVKLDTVGDDATADLNHHRVNGGHYPAPSVSTVSRYLKQTPAGDVTWGEGVPIEQAAVKDLSNVPAGTTATINISGNAATATSAATAASCSGNAATASDMAAGHVLAGKTTAEAVRSALSVPTRDLGDLSQVGTTKIANMALPSYRQVDISVQANWATYTMPYDGYLNMQATSTGAGYISMSSNVVLTSHAYASGATLKTNIPVMRGDPVQVGWSAMTSVVLWLKISGGAH